jgi:hypothetical protein
MGFDSKRKAEVFVTAEGPIEPAKKVPGPKPDAAIRLGKIKGQYDGAAASLRDPEPFGRLSYEAGLLQIPGFNWCHGSWTILKKQGGWKDELTGRFVSIEQVREAIESRIRELGLDRELIDTYMAPGSYQEATIENVNAALRRLINQQAWESLPFDERMNKFRRGVL